MGIMLDLDLAAAIKACVAIALAEGLAGGAFMMLCDATIGVGTMAVTGFGGGTLTESA